MSVRPSVDVESVLADHSAGRSPGFLLWHTTLRWQREAAEALREVSLTHVQFLVLASTWWLSLQGDAPNQRQVAEHAGLDQVMTSQVTRTLERNGLIARVRSTVDSRSWELELTREGLALARRAVVLMVDLDERFFAVARSTTALVEDLRLLAGRNDDGAAVQEGD